MRSCGMGNVEWVVKSAERGRMRVESREENELVRKENAEWAVKSTERGRVRVGGE